MDVVQAVDLTKRFGDLVAVDRVSINANKSEVFDAREL